MNLVERFGLLEGTIGKSIMPLSIHVVCKRGIGNTLSGSYSITREDDPVLMAPDDDASTTGHA